MKAKDREYRLRVRVDNLRQAGRDVIGANSDRALAAALGIDYAGLSKLLCGHREPSAQFIVVSLVNLDRQFDDLFAIDAPAEKAAA